MKKSKIEVIKHSPQHWTFKIPVGDLTEKEQQKIIKRLKKLYKGGKDENTEQTPNPMVG